VLLPLVAETAGKISDMPPLEAQTGPAFRSDRDVMAKHVNMLEEPALQTIYKLLSQSIYREKIHHE
jgi:hypothetical protein